MAILAHDCPHCRTAHVSLQIKFGYAFNNRSGIVGLICPKCHYPSGAHIVRDFPIEAQQDIFSTIVEMGGDPQDNFYNISGFWPSIAAPIIPQHLPGSVERAALQAERNFAMAGNEDAAAMMYRRAMETGLRLRYPEVTGSLFHRIESLVASRELPAAMGEWAHEVRLGGNGAAHDEEGVTPEDVKAIRGFTDTLLRYIFTLPEEIRLRREARQA